MIADDTLIALVSGPVGLGIGAAAYKLIQDWRKRREEREDKRLEMEHDEELKRIEAERQARIAVAVEEAKARVAEAAADEVTGQHAIAAEAQREERTEAKLWERLEKLEERVAKRDRIIRALRTDVDKCKTDHLACLDREAATQQVFAIYRQESDEKIAELQSQVKRQDEAMTAMAGGLLRSGSLSPQERREVRRTISNHSGFPAQSADSIEELPVVPGVDKSKVPR